MAEGSGVRGYWLRCRLTGAVRRWGLPGPPELERLAVERAAVRSARHAAVINNEPVGVSDGSAGQAFVAALAAALARPGGMR
jgi:hypothetical protein